MYQKLPVGGFKWKKNMSKFTARRLHAICMIKKLCYSHKIIKTSLKSWTNIKEDS